MQCGEGKDCKHEVWLGTTILTAIALEQEEMVKVPINLSHTDCHHPQANRLSCYLLLLAEKCPLYRRAVFCYAEEKPMSLVPMEWPARSDSARYRDQC
jgi:hypothetical protein